MNLDKLQEDFEEAFQDLRIAGKELSDKTIELMGKKNELESAENSLLSNKQIEGANAEIRKAVLFDKTFAERLEVNTAESALRQAKRDFAQAKSKLDELEIYLRIEELKSKS